MKKKFLVLCGSAVFLFAMLVNVQYSKNGYGVKDYCFHAQAEAGILSAIGSFISSKVNTPKPSADCESVDCSEKVPVSKSGSGSVGVDASGGDIVVEGDVTYKVYKGKREQCREPSDGSGAYKDCSSCATSCALSESI